MKQRTPLQKILDWVEENKRPDMFSAAFSYVVKMDDLRAFIESIKEEENIILKLKIDDIPNKGMHYPDNVSRLVDFCQKNKIKFDQPKDKETGLYKTLIIHLDTLYKQMLFQMKYTDLLKKLNHNNKNQRI